MIIIHYPSLFPEMFCQSTCNNLFFLVTLQQKQPTGQNVFDQSSLSGIIMQLNSF